VEDEAVGFQHVVFVLRNYFFELLFRDHLGVTIAFGAPYEVLEHRVLVRVCEV
jgi:hypothetical protein